jgi:hypothetical protein
MEEKDMDKKSERFENKINIKNSYWIVVAYL